MSERDRWKVVLILLKFMQEADDSTLCTVALYAAKKMVQAKAGEQWVQGYQDGGGQD